MVQGGSASLSVTQRILSTLAMEHSGCLSEQCPDLKSEASFNKGTCRQSVMKETARSLERQNPPFFIALHWF